MRLFLGLEIPEEIAERLSLWTGGFYELAERGGFRIATSSNYHITLRFFGETSPEVREKLESSIQRLQIFSGNSVLVQGIGVFPGVERPKVLWAGVKASESMKDWAGAAEKIARDCGFSPEERPFRPHITLARIGRRPPEGWFEPLLKSVPESWGEFIPARVALYQSISGESGPEYRKLKFWPCTEETL